MARTLRCSARSELRQRFEDLTVQARRSGYRVKEMAGQLGCSCRWLELICRKEFALTPHALLARLRHQEIQQLARTDMPAKAICQMVGLADPVSFCHSLKRSAGCTLRELRERTRNDRSRKDNNSGSPKLSRAGQGTLVRGST